MGIGEIGRWKMQNWSFGCLSNNNELLRKLQFQVAAFAVRQTERKQLNCYTNFLFPFFLDLNISASPMQKGQRSMGRPGQMPSENSKIHSADYGSVVRIFMDIVMALSLLGQSLLLGQLKCSHWHLFEKKKGINCQVVKLNIYKCHKRWGNEGSHGNWAINTCLRCRCGFFVVNIVQSFHRMNKYY